MTERFCKDCRHCKPAASKAPGIRSYANARCVLEYETNLVSGLRTYALCWVRRAHKDKACGPKGREWQPLSDYTAPTENPTFWQRWFS